MIVGRLCDFFPLLSLAHLVDHFCFMAWTGVLSFCSLFSPSFGCFVLIKFCTIWSLDSMGFPHGMYPNETRKNQWSQTSNRKLAGKQRYIFFSCTCRAAHWTEYFLCWKTGSFSVGEGPGIRAVRPGIEGGARRLGVLTWHQGLQRTLWQT
jgi:hypothetical protein